jgi:hypothetical protein
VASVSVQINTSFQGTGAGAAKVALGQVGQSASKAEKELLSYASAVARSQSAQGDFAGSARTMQAALNQVTNGTREAIRAETQLAQAHRRATGETKGFTQTVQGLQSAVGTLGVAFGAQQVVQFGIDAGRAALSLREQQNTLRALAGTTEQYNSILATARQQQVLFGGTLQENIAGMQGLVITSRSTGASLEALIGLSQRLAVLDPAQGAEGARIALSEVLSGDPRSLARRYEIPLSALERIKDESIPVAERLQVLDQYLNKIGITGESVAGRIDPAAESFRKLGAAADTAKTTVGGFLADAFAPAAEIGTNLLGIFSGTRQGFEDAAVGAQEFSRTLVGLPPASEVSEASIRGMTQAFQEFLFGAQSSADAASVAGQAAVQLGAAMDEERTAVANAAQARAEANLSLAEQAQKSLDAKIQAQELANFQASLASLSGQVSDGHILNAQAAAQLASQYGIATDAAFALLNAQAKIARTPPPPVQGIGSVRTPLSKGKGLGGAAGALGNLGSGTAGIRAAAAQELAIIEARNTQLLQTGSTLDILTFRQKEYNDAVRRFGAGSVKAIDAQTELKRAQEAHQRFLDKPPKGGRGKKDPNAVGLGVFDRDAIALAGDATSQLAEVNAQLAKGNLTEHQRNQLLIKQADLQEKIADETERATKANVDAQLKTVQDAKARLKEAREAAGLQRFLAAGRGTPEQQQAAALRLQEIGLEQEGRRLDIAKAERDAGGLTPINGMGIPQWAGTLPGASPTLANQSPMMALASAGGAAPLSSALPANAGAASSVVIQQLTIVIDKNGAATVQGAQVGTVDIILGSSRQNLAAGGR